MIEKAKIELIHQRAKLLFKKFGSLLSKKASIQSVLEKYDINEAKDIIAFNLFRESFSTIFKDGNGENLTNGFFDATNDARLEWLVSKLDIKNKKILELGLLEA